MHCHLHILPRFAGDSFRISADWSTPTREELDAVALEIAMLCGYSPPPFPDAEEK